MDREKPILGITMGDPCGIGAEIVIRALAREDVAGLARFVVFGLSEQLAYTADKLEIELPFAREHHEDLQRRRLGPLTVLDYDELAVPAAMPRGPSRVGGEASYRFCVDAIDAALAGQIDGIVTAPISKTSWQLAGHKRFPGHTELLADRCRAKRVAMMFHTEKLKVVLATIHEPLSSLPNKLNIGAVFNPLDLADAAMRRWFGCEQPRIAVCGFNPHAGEAGRFGDEEQRVIEPAIVMAREAGIDARGPFPADTIFGKALHGDYDCVLAMYHDQGMIPVKVVAFEEVVNLTLGLPIVRTSPGHGTAFDIAGRGVADPSSLIAAIRLAADIAARQRGLDAPGG
jgi:4-hydroxythreonine-4-phosphate dehydrogenase